MMTRHGKIFFVLLLAVSRVTISSIVRFSCKTMAHFDVILNNYALTGTALATYQSQKSRRQCVLKCISNPQCKCLNYYEMASKCELFDIRFKDVGQRIAVRNGWSFVATSNENTTCIDRPNPCANNGQCFDSCNAAGYTCVCPEYYFGANCEDDIQALLDKYCETSFSGTVARLDGESGSVDAYLWRCYSSTTLREDGLFWSTTRASYFTRPAELKPIISKHLNESEYIVGALGQSCTDACTAAGKTCKVRIETLNSVHLFHMAGVSCKLPRGTSTGLSPYYMNKEDPCYRPSDGYCYGFARVQVIDCNATHSEKRRLCRCT